MLLKKYFFLFILFFICNYSYSQLQSYKKGLASFDKGYYNIAIAEFSKTKNLGPQEEMAMNSKIAEAYWLTNRPIEALPYYEKAFSAGYNSPEALFNYAYGLKENGEYEKSQEYFKKFIDSKYDNQVLQNRAQTELNLMQIVKALKSKNADIEIKNLSAINTKGSEFSPVFYDGNLIFTSSRKEKIYANGLPYLGIYKTKIKSEDISDISEVVPFSTNILDDERNEGSIAISPDGKTAVFARGNSGKRSDLSPDVDLYMSKFSPSNGWTEPTLISASDSASWDGSPCFSTSGTTLYFASNRVGGVGGIDLYSVNMDASGRFGNPKNMGRAINSAGNDMFPFVSSEGKLYFASDGQPGLGGLDLFEAVRADGKISIQNMGTPYNSSRDDFGFQIDEKGNFILSSNRDGGKGDDDIYYYVAPTTKVEKEPEPEIIAKVVNYHLVGEVVSNENKPIPGAKIGIVTFDNGLENKITEITTDENGKFGPIDIQEGTDYVILAEKNDYLTERTNFSMLGRNIPAILLTKPVTDTTFNTKIILNNIFVGKTFKLQNIYYDLDRYEIRSDAAVELDKLVQILQDNPKLKIELGSHTDNRGSGPYNQKLSQKRAESVIQYLQTRGIAPERLEARGYGEEELLIEDAKTEEEHQSNRRTEFKIIEIGQ